MMHAWGVSVAAILALILPRAAEAAPAARDRFVAQHLCAVRTLLTRIHENGPRNTSRNRFLVVAMRGYGQNYVQCIFIDEDRRMLCEASSGVHRYTADSDIRLRQEPRSVAALMALGFAQPDARANFAREVELGTPPDLDIPARLILTALHDGYDAEGVSLDMTAPMAGAEPACGIVPAGQPAATVRARVVPDLNARPESPAPAR